MNGKIEIKCANAKKTVSGKPTGDKSEIEIESGAIGRTGGENGTAGMAGMAGCEMDQGWAVLAVKVGMESIAIRLDLAGIGTEDGTKGI